MIAIIATYAFNAAWQVPLLAVVAWCLTRLMRRLGAAFEHKLWVGALLISVMLPFASLRNDALAPARAMTLAPFTNSAEVAPPPPGIALVPSGLEAIAGLYLALLVFFTLRLVLQIRGTRSLLYQAHRLPAEFRWANDWEHTKGVYRVPSASLRYVSGLQSPATAGFFRPVLLLQPDFESTHSLHDFLAVAGHECSHIRRNDFCKNLFYEAASLLTAFHPATWFLKSQIAQTRELICDQLATDLVRDRNAYAQALLHLAEAAQTCVPALGLFDANILERRIMTLTTPQSQASKLRRYLSGAVAALCLTACAGAGLLWAQSVAPSTKVLADWLQDKLGRQDLTCTYYGNDDDGVFKGLPGTCWRDRNNSKNYRCYRNSDPAQNQSQIGCEWKVSRALGKKDSGH